jgi:hypothetical protein
MSDKAHSSSPEKRRLIEDVYTEGRFQSSSRKGRSNRCAFLNGISLHLEKTLTMVYFLGSDLSTAHRSSGRQARRFPNATECHMRLMDGPWKILQVLATLERSLNVGWVDFSLKETGEVVKSRTGPDG